MEYKLEYLENTTHFSNNTMWPYDIPSALICIIIIFIAWRMKTIPDWVATILAIFSFLPFFLNGLLLPTGFMNDQSLYSSTLNLMRTGNASQIDHLDHHKVVMTTRFLTFIPLPFIETINSVGFFNRFLFLILFIWLYQKKFLRGLPLYFILFYPSLLLYTSLSLRDPLIMFLMTISVIFFIDKKYFRFFLVISPLYILKFQNFFLMIIFFVIFIILKKDTLFYKIRYPLIGLIIIIMGLNLEQIIFLFNRYRNAMFFENFVYGSNSTAIEQFQRIEGLYSFFILSLKNIPYYILKPLPWEAESFFQSIQSFENILILLFLIVFTKKAYAQSLFLTNKWLLFFLITMGVYGIIVFNFGTGARYKYPFMVIYVIGLSYDLYKNCGYRFDLNSKKKKTTNNI